jgi:hypothetical protein
MGFFGSFAFWVKFEVGLEFGDRFLLLFHLLSNFGECVVSR